MNTFKFFAIASFLLISKMGLAQSSAVTSAWNYMRYEEYDKAQKYIDEAANHDGTKDEPKTWLYRGQIYENLGSHAAKKPAYKALSADPFGEAINSFNKCISLDTKKRYSDEAALELQKLMIMMRNAGAGAYNSMDFASALAYFEKYSTAKSGLEKFVNKFVADTSVIYYIAVCNYSLKNYDQAKAGLLLLSDTYKYPEGSVYNTLCDIYLENKDTASAMKILEKGMVQSNEKGKVNVQISHFNLLSKQGKYAQAIEDGQKLLAASPDNVSIYKALGIVYQKASKYKEAEDLYNKLYAKSPNDLDVNLMLGETYYNQGYELYMKAQDAKDDKTSNKLEADADVYFKKSIPYFETAYKLKSDDEMVKKALMAAYSITGNQKKADELKGK